MKKIVLSLAGVMAAVAFAPEASAVPVFARQTGMACSACHFQHFPLLNGFGRAFKSAGFTMMGAQGKVEGEHLDIPDRLNWAVLSTTRYEAVSGNAPAATGSQRFRVPSAGGEAAMFFGGRISEFAGFLSEMGASAKIAVLFPVADARVGFVAHSSGGQGVAYSFETQNTGAANTHKTAFYSGAGTANGGAGNHVNVTSASQYMGTNGAATGISLVANNSMGFINIGKYSAAGVAGFGVATMPLNYVRVAGNVDLAGFDAGFGIQSFGGTDAVTSISARANIIDAQLQGEVADLPAGFYASYGAAPVAAVGSTNALNPVGTATRSSLNLVGEIGVIPHIATVIAGVRMAKLGGSAAGTAGANDSDNGLMLGATYELAQNVELSLTHTRNSGAAWATPVGGVAPYGKTETGLMMEALF
jgi:hypothetical protein